MTAIQYLSAFRLYGWEVLLLAGGVTLLTSLLKKTVLKNVANRLYVFVPFAVGIAVYALFRALVTHSLTPLTTGFAETLEGGFACGCAATLYYVVYEQFFRKRGTMPAEEEKSTDMAPPNGGSADTPPADEENADMAPSPVAPLLEGYVPEETRPAVADALSKGAITRTGAELRAFVRETLLAACPAAPEAEIMALTELVAAYLDALRGA